jgi:hypothetical protein
VTFRILLRYAHCSRGEHELRSEVGVSGGSVLAEHIDPGRDHAVYRQIADHLLTR